MMRKHLRYLSYVVRHKWFVFLEAIKLGIPWLGFWHDMSKFRPDEWRPYAAYFYGPQPVRDSTGYSKPADTGDAAFDFAWLLHQKRNPHHWQFWILPEDNGGTKILRMPWRYQAEMLADWRGAGKAQGYGDNTLVWYNKNKQKMQLHPDTRAWVVAELVWPEER